MSQSIRDPRTCEPHCWHATNQSYTTNPPMPIERCCFCGQTKAKMQPGWTPDPKHGPYQ